MFDFAQIWYIVWSCESWYPTNVY